MKQNELPKTPWQWPKDEDLFCDIPRSAQSGAGGIDSFAHRYMDAFRAYVSGFSHSSGSRKLTYSQIFAEDREFAQRIGERMLEVVAPYVEEHKPIGAFPPRSIHYGGWTVEDPDSGTQTEQLYFQPDSIPYSAKAQAAAEAIRKSYHRTRYKLDSLRYLIFPAPKSIPAEYCRIFEENALTYYRWLRFMALWANPESDPTYCWNKEFNAWREYYDQFCPQRPEPPRPKETSPAEPYQCRSKMWEADDAARQQRMDENQRLIEMYKKKKK